MCFFLNTLLWFEMKVLTFNLFLNIISLRTHNVSIPLEVERFGKPTITISFLLSKCFCGEFYQSWCEIHSLEKALRSFVTEYCFVKLLEFVTFVVPPRNWFKWEESEIFRLTGVEDLRVDGILCIKCCTF